MRSTAIVRLWSRAAICIALAASTSLSAAPALAATADDASTRQAAVQAMFDQLVGVGHAIVRVTERTTTGDETVSSTHYNGSSYVTQLERQTTVFTTGKSTSTSWTAVTPETRESTTRAAGAILSEDVLVVLDRAVVAPKSLPRLRALLASAAGFDRRRGDKLSIALVTFATPRLPSTVIQGWQPPQWLFPGIGSAVLVLLAAVLALGSTLRRRASHRSLAG